MYNPRLRRILLITLAAGCALAVLAIGFETGWGQHLRPVPPEVRLAPANLGDLGVHASFNLGALDQQFQESGNRPLFAPSRRLAPAAQQASAIVRGQFQLVGTSITKEFGDSAMLREVATNKTTVVKKGTAIKDMTVDTVHGDRVILKKGDETEELFMKAQGSPKQPPVMVGQEGPLGASPVAGRGTPPSGPGTVTLPQPLPPTAGPIPPAGPIPTAPGMPRPAGQAQVMPGASLPASEPQRPSITAEEILERRRRARAQQTQ